MEKKYPFNMEKHAHDIEFWCNRTYNNMVDAENDGDYEKAEEWEKLHDEAEELLTAILNNSPDGRVSYLPGPQISRAKEIVTWASNTRAETQFMKNCRKKGETT